MLETSCLTQQTASSQKKGAVREFGRSRFVVVALSHADTNYNFGYIYVVGGAPDGGETPAGWSSVPLKVKLGAISYKDKPPRSKQTDRVEMGSIIVLCPAQTLPLTVSNVDTLAPVSQ